MNTASLAEEKARMRRSILDARSALAPGLRAAGSRTIIDQVLGLPERAAATTVAAYLGLGDEIATVGFARQTIQAGQRLALPRVVDVESRSRRHLVLHRVEDIERDTRPGRWGILEPVPERCATIDPAEVDFILLPGVAFDTAGGRLGYGAGFYDRLLGSIRTDCLRVAAAFSIQIVPQVPLEPHDQRYHLLITEQHLLRAPDTRNPTPDG